MSYAHTKRRKNIARLKRTVDRWYPEFQAIGQAVRKRNEGPLIGSVEDLLRQRLDPG